VFGTGAAAAGVALRAGPRLVREGDLVPNRDYWVTLLVMAERFAAGRGPLAV